MHRTLRWLAGAALALAVTPASSMPPPFPVGRPFPTILLPSIADGSPSSITDFRGKKLVLHIFASW